MADEVRLVILSPDRRKNELTTVEMPRNVGLRLIAEMLGLVPVTATKNTLVMGCHAWSSFGKTSRYRQPCRIHARSLANEVIRLEIRTPDRDKNERTTVEMPRDEGLRLIAEIAEAIRSDV